MNAAGILRHRVIFRTPVLVSDGQGGSTVTYPNADVSAPCATESVAGQEAFGPGNPLVTSEVQRLTLRRRAGLSVQQRADVTFTDTGETASYQVQRVERADDLGVMLAVYCTKVEA